MRFHKLAYVIALTIIASQSVLANRAGAFPGDRRDEQCSELIAAAIAA